MFGDLSQQTFDLLNKVELSTLNKTTISQGTGLNAFDLRGPALQLFPVITPLRNRLPRQLSDGGDLATRWKAITGVNTSGFELGVAPGRRSAEMAVTEQDYVASYAGIGLEASIDWEAVWAGGKEFDNKATLVQSLLRAVMIGEENIILNGNASMPLGTPAAPSVQVTTGGTLPAGSLLVFVAALTPRALANATVANGVPFGQVTRVNIDGTTTQYGAGVSAISPASSVAATGSGSNTVLASVPQIEQLTLWEVNDLMTYWQDYPPTHVMVAAYLMGSSKRPRPPIKDHHKFSELSQAVALAGGSSTSKLPQIYRSSKRLS